LLKFFGGCSCSNSATISGAHRTNGSTTVFKALFWFGLVLALASATNSSATTTAASGGVISASPQAQNGLFALIAVTVFMAFTMGYFL